MKIKEFECLIPEIVANSVSQEHSVKLMQIFRHLMTHSEQFSTKITDTDKGRDLLHSFMQHWLDGYNKQGTWLHERQGAIYE